MESFGYQEQKNSLNTLKQPSQSNDANAQNQANTRRFSIFVKNVPQDKLDDMSHVNEFFK